MNGTIAMAPLLPVAFIAGFAAVGLLLCLVMAWRRGGGALWRAAAVTALTMMALNPRIVDEQR